MNNAEVAERLVVSQALARNNVSAILSRLGAANHTKVAALAGKRNSTVWTPPRIAFSVTRSESALLREKAYMWGYPDRA